ISGDTIGVRGQDRSFTVSATSADGAVQAAGYTYTVDWGDGNTTTVARTAGNAAGVGLTHAYTTEGTHTVTVTATDKDGRTSADASLTVSITITAIETDADGKIVLAVGGTTGDDSISVKLRIGHEADQLTVKVKDTEFNFQYKATYPAV